MDRGIHVRNFVSEHLRLGADHDQALGMSPPFQGQKIGNRSGIPGVGGDAPDPFGRMHHQTAVPKNPHRKPQVPFVHSPISACNREFCD
jgi:hypothetical protein